MIDNGSGKNQQPKRGDGFIGASGHSQHINLNVLQQRLATGAGASVIPMKITACDKGSGLAAVTEQTMAISNGAVIFTNGTQTSFAFIGIGSWWRKDDIVFCLKLKKPVGNLRYLAVQGMYGPYFWEPPDPMTDPISEIQDKPEPDTYCTDTVGTE